MKLMAIILFGFLISSNAFAASTLFCDAEDGTTITAVESPDQQGVFFNIEISIRGGKRKPYPKAYASQFKDSNGDVSFMVITDPVEGILIVVNDGTLIDSTGAYEIDSCTVGM